VTGVTIYALMVLATASLLLGARLLDGPAIPSALGLLAIVVGIVLAAAALVGAWRPRAPRGVDEPTSAP
jgi:hypothetical protein